MPTSRKRATTAAALTKVTIDQAHLALADLPEKTKDELSMQEAMTQLYPTITATLEKGYSLEEVSDLLNQQQIDINASSLKYYLTRLKKQQDVPSVKGRRTRQPRAEKAPVPLAADEPAPSINRTEPVMAAPEPAPPVPEAPQEAKPATRRRATAAPKAETKSAAKRGRPAATAKVEKPAAKTRRRTKAS